MVSNGGLLYCCIPHLLMNQTFIIIDTSRREKKTSQSYCEQKNARREPQSGRGKENLLRIRFLQQANKPPIMLRPAFDEVIKSSRIPTTASFSNDISSKFVLFSTASRRGCCCMKLLYFLV